MESPKRGCDLGTCVLKSKKKRIAIVFFCDLKTSLGARACVQVLCVQKNAAFRVCVLKPTKFGTGNAGFSQIATPPGPLSSSLPLPPKLPKNPSQLT